MFWHDKPCIVIENTFIKLTAGIPSLPEAKRRNRSAGPTFRYTKETTDFHDGDVAIKHQLDRLNALLHSVQTVQVFKQTIQTELMDQQSGRMDWDRLTVTSEKEPLISNVSAQNANSKVLPICEVSSGTADWSATPHESAVTPVSPQTLVLPRVHMQSSSSMVPSTSSLHSEESQTMVDGQCANSGEDNVMEEGMTMVGTTAMLRNIPFWYTLSDLTLELNELGFSSKFDQLYFAGNKPRCGCGYAFVRLKTQEFYNEFKGALHGYHFKLFQNKFSKAASVSSAKRRSYQAAGK